MRGHTQPWTTPPRADVVFNTVHPRRSHRPTLRAINPTFSTTSTYLHDGKEGETSVRSGVAVRTGVRSTAWTRITGRSRRRLRKKEKKKIDKVRFFYRGPRTRRRAARAPVSSARSPQARAMIEYHKCRVSSFSNWASIPAQKSTSRRPRFYLVTRTGQGGLSGEAQARGRRRGAHRPNSAHRARGVAARPPFLNLHSG